MLSLRPLLPVLLLLGGCDAFHRSDGTVAWRGQRDRYEARLNESGTRADFALVLRGTVGGEPGVLRIEHTLTGEDLLPYDPTPGTYTMGPDAFTAVVASADAPACSPLPEVPCPAPPWTYVAEGGTFIVTSRTHTTIRGRFAFDAQLKSGSTQQPFGQAVRIEGTFEALLDYE